MKDKESKVSLSFSVPEALHRKVLRLQSVFKIKENSRISLRESYTRIIERGVAELNKQNKI